MSKKVESKCRGKTRSAQDQDTWVRLESLEHLMNQHDILLESLLTMLEKSMDVSTDTSDSIWDGELDM